MLRRAVFSDFQRKGLEKRFQQQKYISKPDRKKLAEKLGLKDSQVSHIISINLKLYIKILIDKVLYYIKMDGYQNLKKMIFFAFKTSLIILFLMK